VTPDVNTIPTWRELAERFRDLVKDFLRKGKNWSASSSRSAPSAETIQLEIEKLISKLEQRATKKTD